MIGLYWHDEAKTGKLFAGGLTQLKFLMTCKCVNDAVK